MIVKTNLVGYQVDIDTNGNYIPQKIHTVPDFNEKTGEVNKTAGKEMIDNLGYCSSMTSALKRIAKNSLHSVGLTMSIEAYIKKLEVLHEKLGLDE